MANFDNIGASLKNVFSYVVHRESAADYARKTQAVVALVAASHVALGTTEDMKLNELLATMKTRDLDILLENKVAVCLDPRLSKLEIELRDRAVFGALYANGDKGYIAAINPGGYLSHAPDLMKRLADGFRSGGITQSTPPMYGTVHVVSAARTAVTYMNWDSPDMNARTVAKNPAIKNPPKP